MVIIQTATVDTPSTVPGSYSRRESAEFARAKDQIELGPHKAGGIEVMMGLAFGARSGVKKWACQYMQERLRVEIGSDDATPQTANSL